MCEVAVTSRPSRLALRVFWRAHRPTLARTRAGLVKRREGCRPSKAGRYVRRGFRCPTRTPVFSQASRRRSNGPPACPGHIPGRSQADPRQVPGRFSPWGKFFACTLARGIPSAGRNFLGRGEGCEESHSQVPDTPVRPSVPSHQRRRPLKFRCFSARISCKVFRLWHEWHRLWWFVGSVNSFQSPLNGSMWSTSVASVRIPRFAHSLQNGSRRSCAGRKSFFHSGRLYQLCQDALSAPRSRFGRCAGHQPSRVSSVHPGCLHGRSGLMAMGYHLQAKQKACAESQSQPGCNYGTGTRHGHSSIFTMLSTPQRLQKTTRFFAFVPGINWRTFAPPQCGQMSHPESTVSISPRWSTRKAFFTFLLPLSGLIYLYSSPK